MKTLLSVFVLVLTLGSASAFAQAKGSLAGSCTMQTDQNFKVAHNGTYDNKGQRVNTPYVGWAQSWPITSCPSSGDHTSVQCADGWRPVMQNLTQMDCRTSGSATQLCWTYWITYACAKQ